VTSTRSAFETVFDPATRRLRVVLADDSVLLREGLIRLLEEAGCTIVAAVGDGGALIVTL